MIFKSADTERQRETETDRECLDFLYIINVVTLVNKGWVKSSFVWVQPNFKNI